MSPDLAQQEVSEEGLFDEKRHQFSRSWQAVRYRYRTCAECVHEFQSLINSSSEIWKAGWPDDEELNYKLDPIVCLFLCLVFQYSRVSGLAFTSLEIPFGHPDSSQ